MQPSPPILFPTDFDSHSQSAFEHAIRLASACGSKLIALHVSNMPDMVGEPSEPTHHEMLRDKLKHIEASQVDVEHIFAVAEPGPEICRLAQERGCEMIVMGVTEREGMDELVGGGVHDYVQRNAACPVVTLRVKPKRLPDESLWR